MTFRRLRSLRRRNRDFPHTGQINTLPGRMEPVRAPFPHLRATCSGDWLKLCNQRPPLPRRIFRPLSTVNLLVGVETPGLPPGNVMIEDGLENFPPLSGNALLRTPPLPPEGAVRSQDPRFEPQAPMEIQRTSRRVPGIEDFPPQAQKEWDAHHGRTSRPGNRDAEEPRKPGLLERFAGLSRK